MSRRGNTTREIDWITVLLYLALVFTGWLMIYSVSYTDEYPNALDFSRRQGSQFIWMIISFVAGLFVLIVDNKFYRTFAYPIYFFVMFLLLLVLFVGQEVAGSTSWFKIGGFFKFQPAEFGKFATCLGLANYLSGYNVSLQDNRSRLIAIGIILLPMSLILLQGDAGSALVFTALFIVLFREGMPAILYVAGGIIAILSIVALIFARFPILAILLIAASFLLMVNLKNNRSRIFLGLLLLSGLSIWGLNNGFLYQTLGVNAVIFLSFFILNIRQKSSSYANLILIGLVFSIAYTFSVNYGFSKLKPHQKDRINVWLQPSQCDPLGSLYNLNQSKMAIGSGGLWGKGFQKGPMTQMNYVPEQPTDFIFCTIGEEHGFLGTFGFIMLFLLLLLRITEIAERQRSKFSRLYAYGVASILFFHFMINVGMTIGVMPVIGIPLPFISYGGSSLLSFTILLAILVRLDNARLNSF